MATILNGKEVAGKLKSRLIKEVTALKSSHKITPCLAVILVGEDPASAVYVRRKREMCEQIGIKSELIIPPASITQNELIALINELNARADVHGILCQLPLPRHINPKIICETITPSKDVDCFNPTNVGNLVLGENCFKPCTPAGIIDILDEYGIEIEGANCVIIGRSDIVGKPVSMLMLHRSATVTICHSKTKNLPKVCQNADILIAAVGVPNFVKADMVRPGAVVIDVGINRTENGLVGDVDFENVKDIAGAITPVPGGVGPMTIVKLMQNTIEAAKKSNNIK